jgi:hypothetical protein
VWWQFGLWIFSDLSTTSRKGYASCVAPFLDWYLNRQVWICCFKLGQNSDCSSVAVVTSLPCFNASSHYS